MSQINESAIATPGVYVTEIPAFPPSVAQVATAIPVFVGYAPVAVQNGKPVFNTAVRISSLVEFTSYFGTGFSDLQANVVLKADNSVDSVYFNNASFSGSTHGFQLFNAIQMFFNQGGGDCWILALPLTNAGPQITDFLPTAAGTKTVIDIIQKEDEPTLIVVPDAILLPQNDFNNVMNACLALCGTLQDRFTILDIYNGDEDRDYASDDVIDLFRNGISSPSLNYGAAYYPWLRTSLPYTPTLPNTFAYNNIKLQQPAGTAVNGSAILNSAQASQLELANADMKNIISVFVNTPNLGNLAGLPGSLNTTAPHAPINSGFGLIPQAPQISSHVEITAKLTYIDELLKGFMSLTGFTDNQPAASTQTIYNNYIVPGTVSGTIVNYSPIELILKEFFLLNESYPGAAIIAAPTSTGGYPNIDVANIPVDNTIYGTVATDDSYVSFTRIRVLNLYNSVASYINSFVADVAARITSLESQLVATNTVYAAIKTAIANEGVVTPPSGAIAGVYAAVDGTRGVWKAPANVPLNTVIEPMVDIDDDMQANLNIDPNSGKSINAIRSFTGKGIYVWGARTLTGNDNDFRYVSVRRFFIMVEESVKLAAYQFVFEPNDANTWVRVRAMIENYLTNLWRQGALAGPKPEASFWVKVGLGQTMIFQDVLEGRMIVEIGMAPVRPAEFIILRFTQIQQTA
jgi:phage tail sheath protein FI